MVHHIWIRLTRRPLEAIAVLLFTAVIALVLCGLHMGNEEARKQYEEIYTTIDVRCTVTNLAGDQSDKLPLSVATLGLFTGTYEHGSSDLMPYVEDVQIKGSEKILRNGKEYTLTAITSTKIAPALWPENGCVIFWQDDYDERVFGGEELVCLIPEALAKELEEQGESVDTLPLFLEAEVPQFQTDYEGELTIVGTYSSEDTTTIYLPWTSYVGIRRSCNSYENVQAIRATLRDNRTLAEFRAVASAHFVEPNPNYAGRVDVDGFYQALDINDYQLKQADLTLRNSMRVNELVTLLVFVASALAGFFVGFLVIRSRKREITLMRTLGCSNGRIYEEFAMEQLLCILGGVLLGGGYTLWQPLWKLAVFAVVNFAGLSTALLVFLNVNLLATIKEDE